MFSRLLALCLICSTCLAAPAGADQIGLENKIKAAYLFNFLLFAEWPALEGSGAGTPVRLCVIGSESLGQLLAELGNRDIKGRPLAIESLPGLNSRKQNTCHLLFVDRKLPTNAANVAEQLPRENVLTVSDAPGFAESGGMIGFYQEDGRIKIAINLRRAREARVTLSAKLLEVARIVD